MNHHILILIVVTQVRRTALGFQRGSPFGTPIGCRHADGTNAVCIRSVSCLYTIGIVPEGSESFSNGRAVGYIKRHKKGHTPESAGHTKRHIKWKKISELDTKQGTQWGTFKTCGVV